ncbi:MAG: pyridoxal phosphate-dependent aminotransferase [Clostridium sp.]|jgi:aspartate aminotransferase|nr:pyridoxal phosphate-dependent aminotransferase [Clostridium sp.]
MYSEEMYELGSKGSSIRRVALDAQKRKAEIGEENVFDFSLGNPSIPAPEIVKKTLIEIIENEHNTIHGYTANKGDANVRASIAEYINKTNNTNLTAENIYMTVGACASLSIVIKAIANKGDEIIVFAPFFPEYRVFVEECKAKLVVVKPNMKDFQIDFDEFEKAINNKTKAVIINSPNNPSGVVYTEDTIKKLADVLNKKSKEYGHAIYLISDEPYREIVYDDLKVPCCLNYYDNTFICYSYSKSLSLPGERIGYIAVSNKMEESQKTYLACCGAGRALGYVCAPALFQKLVQKLQGVTVDIDIYKKNRDLIYDGLTKIGYECIKPDGAFYLFVKTLEEDSESFSKKAAEHEIFVVPADPFGCPGYVRISYCVNIETIIKSLPKFEELYNQYS